MLTEQSGATIFLLMQNPDFNNRGTFASLRRGADGTED